jgi:hypothetical protein
MSQPEGTDPPYRVIAAQTVRQALSDLCARAARKGMRQVVEAALKNIHAQLHTNPLGYGESRYPLGGLEMEVRVGITEPLLVYYGVSRRHRLVIIQSFRALPKSGI